MSDTIYDVIIIGGSYAGLSAALQLGRARRRVLVIDEGLRRSTADRIVLHHGDVGAAPAGPFDGAVCLLVFHHISVEERKATLNGVRQRLRPGSPFVLAHLSFAMSEPDHTLWVNRHIKFGAMAELDADKQEAARIGMKERLVVMFPEEEEAHLKEAGFTGIIQFYHAFSFRGWVAYA